MAEEIGRNDFKLHYASLEEARTMSGLRLILGAHTIPGPWREACNGDRIPRFLHGKEPYRDGGVLPTLIGTP